LRSLDSPAVFAASGGTSLGDRPGSPHPRLGWSETSPPKSWQRWPSCTMLAWFGSRPSPGVTTSAPLHVHVQTRLHVAFTMLFVVALTPGPSTERWPRT